MIKPKFFHSFFILLVTVFASGLVGGQSTQLDEQARSCSFADETTGYSLIWHTNCTGYVNFVLNFRNFPAAQGNFWIGVSFNLLSQELVLVEVNNGYVTVQPARIYGNQPPQKNLMSPFLESPRGSFFDASLEVNVFWWGGGGKFVQSSNILNPRKPADWFYTLPSRVGASYPGQPFSKLVCNAAQTCSRNNCIQNQIANQYGRYGEATNYFRPETLVGNTVYNDQYYGQTNNQHVGTYPQAYHNTYVNTQGYGAPANLYGQFGQVSPYRGGTPQNDGRYAAAQYGVGQSARQYSGSALYGSQNMADPYGRGQFSTPSLYNVGVQRSPNYGAVYQQPQHMVPPQISLSQIFAERPNSIYGINPTHGFANVEKVKKSRRKRQTVNKNNNPNQLGGRLQGTAYEGQDKLFERSTPYFDSPYTPYYLQDNKLLYDQVSSNPRGYPAFGAQNTDIPNSRRFIKIGASSAPMYYRTATDYSGEPHVGQPIGLQGDHRVVSFNDVVKCDAGLDPYWCDSYVSQFIHWQQKYKAESPEGICNALRESLRYSDHGCCNTVKSKQC